MATGAPTSISLTLLIDTNSQKVLFAESEKDFVDFLFNLLSVPVATIIRLLTKDSMVGSLGNLYESIGSINESYLIKENEIIETMLRPKSSPLLPTYAPVSKMVYSWTSDEHFIVSDVRDGECPECNSTMCYEVPYLAKSKVSNNNYGTEGITYMIMDDLVVKPISTISSITMLINNFNIKQIGALQEKVVHVDIAQGVELLKASLQSKTVLTNVFPCGSNISSFE